MAAIDDNAGLLWITSPTDRKRKNANDRNVSGRIAAFPYDSSSYVQPELIDPPPGYIALDFETEDPTLLERGSAWAFEGIGQVIGMAVAWEGFEAYYPIAHREGNVDGARVSEWLTAQFKRDDLTFIAANACYDVGWARRMCGIYPAGGVEDVQFMAALLDEYRFSYSLDAISKDYLKIGKDFDFLGDIEKKLSLKHNQVMANLKQLPGPAVASYAATDARRTYDLYMVLKPLIVEEGLLAVHALESALIPMSVEMKRRGIRVNVDEAQRLVEEIKTKRMPGLQDEIKRITGVEVEPWESETLERALKECGIECGRTKTGQPQIDQNMLAEAAKTVPVAAHILALRKMSKIQNTFLDGHVLGHQHKGRVHCDFNQLRSEREDGGGFGTVSGRYSCVRGDTLVLTARGEVPITDVLVGDRVWTHENRWRPVIRVLDQGVQDTFKVTFEDGNFLYCTKSHRLLTSGKEWKFVGDMYEYFKKMAVGSVEYSESHRTIQIIGSSAHYGYSEEDEHDAAQCSGRDSESHPEGRKDRARGPSIFCREIGRIESYARKVSRAASQLEGRKFGFQGLFNSAKFSVEGTGTSISTSQGICGIFGAFFNTSDVRNSSHRRKWGEQFFGQFGFGNVKSAQKNSSSSETRSKVVGIAKIDVSATCQVYDLTVEEDESYLSNGVFSHNCTSPNLQQIPTRDPEWGPLMRGLFLAEDGQQIASLDYSSQEPRLAVHFAAKAKLGGAAEAVAKFKDNPRTDYHQMVADMANIPRKTAKTLNLGLAYGMGGAKLARSLGLPTQWMQVVKRGSRTEWVEIQADAVEELRAQHYDCIEVAGDDAKAIIKKWEEGAPFMRGLFKLSSHVAAQRGYIKTILGRRCRFQIGRDGKYGFTHKALNRLAQGSAADQTKKGMLDMWKQGHVPLLTVHDELVFSVENEAEARKYSPIMENAIPLEVPSVVDVNLGKTWGDVEK